MVSRVRDASLKLETLQVYGGECACCGESEPAFLTIDHVLGTGARERAALWGREHGGGGLPFYRWLKRSGFPQDGRYRVLCMNCNLAIHNLGECPHVTRPSWLPAALQRRHRCSCSS